MSNTVIEPHLASGTDRRNFKVIDCDVHPLTKNGIASVYPYMPDAWKRRFVRKKAEISNNPLSLKYLHPNGSTTRLDALPPCGGAAGSDPKFMVEDLIEKHKIDSIVLNCLQTGALCSSLATVDEGIVLATAFNDYFVNEWLPLDSRLKFAITVPSHDPAAAAEEIRRVGKHPQVVAVAVPMINTLLGNRHFWPIYAAAQEMDLPILLHVTGADAIYYGGPTIAGGVPDSYVERYVVLTQMGESSVNSLVFSGTFEKFPRLKFVFVEYGFLWLLPLLWRMDRTWRSLRHEVPHVKKSPIEYVYEHCRFTTQPLDEPKDPKDLDKLISLLGFDQLCFSTDYPHWDNDMPGNSLRSLPEAEKQKIFYDNAKRLFRF